MSAAKRFLGITFMTPYRPLWNQHARWLRSAPGHHPRRELFVDTPYQPRPGDRLTDTDGKIIGDFIRWINRYGYLSDEKLDIIRTVWP